MHARLTRLSIACAMVSLAVAAVVLGGCNGQGATGTVSLKITDAPFPVDLISEATVTITEVKIRSAASQPSAAASQPSSEESESAESEAAEDGQDTDGDEDAAESSWVTIFEGPKTFNLLDLRNGRTDLLADATVPAGTYTQMRLVVTEGSITLTDGRTFDLKVPSGAQSGIKLHFTFTVEEGETQPLLLDVNLARAFQPIPGSGAKRPEDIKQFHFRPSVAMRLINIVQAGSITGTVTNAAGPLAGVTVAALRDGTEVSATTTEADGTYTLAGLPTGTYAVRFAAEGYTQVDVADVAVTAGEATEGVDVLMEALPPASQPAQ